MRCGRISVTGEAEEIPISRRPRYWKRHVKRSNPHSTRGNLDEFESAYAEPSARREYMKTGAPEAAKMRFVSSKKGWIPVVIGARDQGTAKKSSGDGAAGVSILEPLEKSNSLNHEQEHHRHHNSKAEKSRRPVPMGNRHSTRPARYVEGSDSLDRTTKPAMAYDARVGATIMFITLLCLVFYGWVCVILLTCVWLYVLPMLRESSERIREMNRNHDILTGYLQSSEYKKKVILDGFLDRSH